MAMMREHMRYFWDYTIVHRDNHPLQRNRHTRAGAKSVLCYRQPGSTATPPRRMSHKPMNLPDDPLHRRSLQGWCHENTPTPRLKLRCDLA